VTYLQLKEAEAIMTEMLNAMAKENLNLSPHDAVEGKVKAVGNAAAALVRRGLLTPRMR